MTEHNSMGELFHTLISTQTLPLYELLIGKIVYFGIVLKDGTAIVPFFGSYEHYTQTEFKIKQEVHNDNN